MHRGSPTSWLNFRSLATSTPFASTSESSDDTIEQTLYCNDPADLHDLSNKDTKEDSISSLCTHFMGINIKKDSQATGDSKDQALTSEMMENISDKNDVKMQQQSSLSDSSHQDDGSFVATDDLQKLTAENELDVDRTFTEEASKRCHTRMERAEQNKEFDHVLAALEPITAFGGRFRPNSISPILSVSIHPSPAASPQAMQERPSSSLAHQSIIQGKEDIEKYQQRPKAMFVQHLQKFLASHPIHLPFAHLAAQQFAHKMMMHYKDKDIVRYKCFVHLVYHINVLPLVYLESCSNSADFLLLENLFLRGTDLVGAVASCQLCLAHK